MEVMGMETGKAMKIAVCEDMEEEAAWLCDTIQRWSLDNKVMYFDAAVMSDILLK